MSEFKGLEKAWSKAEPRQSYLPYLKAGKYELEVTSFKHIERRNNTTACVAELKVLSSTNSEFQNGDMVQVMFRFETPYGVPEARQFLAVCLDKPFEDTNLPDLAENTSQKNPLKGTIVFNDAFLYNAKDKNTGQPTDRFYTNHRWKLIAKPGESK